MSSMHSMMMTVVPLRAYLPAISTSVIQEMIVSASRIMVNGLMKARFKRYRIVSD